MRVKWRRHMMTVRRMRTSAKSDADEIHKKNLSTIASVVVRVPGDTE